MLRGLVGPAPGAVKPKTTRDVLQTGKRGPSTNSYREEAEEEERPPYSFAPEELEMCKSCFKKYDLNGDGTIDVFEVCFLFSSVSFLFI